MKGGRKMGSTFVPGIGEYISIALLAALVLIGLVWTLVERIGEHKQYKVRKAEKERSRNKNKGSRD